MKQNQFEDQNWLEIILQAHTWTTFLIDESFLSFKFPFYFLENFSTSVERINEFFLMRLVFVMKFWGGRIFKGVLLWELWWWLFKNYKNCLWYFKNQIKSIPNFFIAIIYLWHQGRIQGGFWGSKPPLGKTKTDD